MSSNQFRRNPITGEWAIVLEEDYDVNKLLARTHVRDSDCEDKQTKFCAGSESETPPEIFAIRDEDTNPNEAGWQVRVLPMESPFLQIYGELNNRGVGLYDVLNGIGAHELVIESNKANHQIAQMELPQIQNILLAYRERILDLKRDTRFRYVMVHKHHGEGDGELRCHSHSHILATPIAPARLKGELVNAREHYHYKERCLFCDIISQELADDERVISQNDSFVILSPFASRSPFTVWIVPKQHETFFEWNTEHSLLAGLLKDILEKFKSVLNDPNFVMVLHTGPNLATGMERGYWKTLEKDYHWYIEITPRFRTYTSFEVGSGFQVNVISPERATRILSTGNLHLAPE